MVYMSGNIRGFMSYLIARAYAETPTAAPVKTESALDAMQFMPFVFIFVVFYFLILRPQQRKFKQHQAMVSAIKRGDKVVTSGGILGKVARVDEGGIIQVEIADGVVVKTMAATITTVVDDKALNDNSAAKK